jgi:hypothetical protein
MLIAMKAGQFSNVTVREMYQPWTQDKGYGYKQQTPLFVGEVGTNFCEFRVVNVAVQHDRLSRFSKPELLLFYSCYLGLLSRSCFYFIRFLSVYSAGAVTL